MKGAKERSLPLSYQNYLQSLASFSKENDRRPLGELGARLFLLFWHPLISYVMGWIKVKARNNKDGCAPEWMGGIVWTLFNLMWLYHDKIHAKIWGRGDGNRLDKRSAVIKLRTKS